MCGVCVCVRVRDLFMTTRCINSRSLSLCVCGVFVAQGEDGEITWICPACKQADDGSPMIGCDVCDDWYHWYVTLSVNTANNVSSRGRRYAPADVSLTVATIAAGLRPSALQTGLRVSGGRQWLSCRQPACL